MSPLRRVNALHATLQARHAQLRSRHTWYAILAEIWASIQVHQPAMLAKQAAYSLLYAAPSMLIVLISLAAIIDKQSGAEISTALQDFVSTNAPADLQPLLQSLVQYALVRTSENSAITAVVLALLVAIWGAAGGVGALIYAINTVYDVHESRPLPKITAVQIGLTLVSGALVLLALVLLALSRILMAWLPDVVTENGLLARVVYSGPLWAIAILFFSLVALYWAGLDTPKSLLWLLPGAVLATLATAILFAALDFILRYSSPGTAFGVAGGVLIFLWTLFMVSQFVVLGAIINAVLGQRYDATLRGGEGEEG